MIAETVKDGYTDGIARPMWETGCEGGTWVNFGKGASSLRGLDHQDVQRVSVTQVGQTFLVAGWSVWMPGCVAVNGGLQPAATTSGSGVATYESQRLLQRVSVLLLQARKAAGELRTGP